MKVRIDAIGLGLFFLFSSCIASQADSSYWTVEQQKIWSSFYHYIRSDRLLPEPIAVEWYAESGHHRGYVTYYHGDYGFWMPQIGHWVKGDGQKNKMIQYFFEAYKKRSPRSGDFLDEMNPIYVGIFGDTALVNYIGEAYKGDQKDGPKQIWIWTDLLKKTGNEWSRIGEYGHELDGPLAVDMKEED